MTSPYLHTLRPLAAAVALALAAPAGAAVIPVDGTTCTLGDAITAANTDAAVGGCPAGSGADTLNLIAPRFTKATPDDATTFGPTAYPWITSVIAVAGDADGDGTGAIIERSSAAGTPDFRLFAIAPTGDLTLDHVTIRNGRAASRGARSGSGIRNERGRLQLSHSIVSGNIGGDGAIVANGNVTLTDSTVTDNGAAALLGWRIYDHDFLGFSTVTISITRSTITNNDYGLLGGEADRVSIIGSTISNNRKGVHMNYGGRLTLTDCTITGNGDGVANWGSDIIATNVTVSDNRGAAFSTDRRSVTTLINSTISGNDIGILDRSYGMYDDYRYYSSDYGRYVFRDRLWDTRIYRSTITGNRIGLSGKSYPGPVTLIGSILSGNGQDCDDDTLGWRSLAGNLIGDGSCDAAALGALTGDAKLGPLKDNGGPTFTHALLKDSPALDAGTGCAATDQRGATRPQGGSCDLGAYESVTRRPPVLRPLLGFFDQAVQAGTLVGTLKAPGRWQRLQAVRRQLLLAGDLQRHGAKTAACKQTGHTLGRIDADGATPDKNDYVTGPAAPELATKLRALRTDIGCS